MLQYKSTNRSEVVMLKRFSVTNYRGFKDTVKLDLTAGNYGFSNNLVKDGIVNKALVFGKNGTGKNNLGFAIMDIIIHLTDKKSYFNNFFQSYCNKYNHCNYAEFEYVFQFGEDEVKYKYRKYAIDKLKYEQFMLNDKVLLDADYDAGTFRIDD